MNTLKFLLIGLLASLVLGCAAQTIERPTPWPTAIPNIPLTETEQAIIRLLFVHAIDGTSTDMEYQRAIGFLAKAETHGQLDVANALFSDALHGTMYACAAMQRQQLLDLFTNCPPDSLAQHERYIQWLRDAQDAIRAGKPIPPRP